VPCADASTDGFTLGAAKDATANGDAEQDLSDMWHCMNFMPLRGSSQVVR
jgi:hypothetical protein